MKTQSHLKPIVPFQQMEEDAELTAFLKQEVDQILSPEHEPKPSCPRCGGTEVVTKGLQRLAGGQRRAVFRCRVCVRSFTRVVGTPFEKRAYLPKLDILIPLLSQPLSFNEAGKRMGSLDTDIKRRVLAIRNWLREIDSTGEWERRVKLGGRFGELDTQVMHFDEVGAEEDLTLTSRLTHAFDEINSIEGMPYPPCVYCGESDVYTFVSRYWAFPRFYCRSCMRNFSRRTGTVFAKSKTKNLNRMREFIRYLSLPLSFMQVSDELKLYEELTIKRWYYSFSLLADQLESDGSLSSRIRLGVQPTDKTPCPHCGRVGSAMKRASGWACSGCGRLFSMRRKVIEQDGRLKIVEEDLVRK
jgi:transposase-like protein